LEIPIELNNKPWGKGVKCKKYLFCPARTKRIKGGFKKISQEGAHV